MGSRFRGLFWFLYNMGGSCLRGIAGVRVYLSSVRPGISAASLGPEVYFFSIPMLGEVGVVCVGLGMILKADPCRHVRLIKN